MLKIGLMLVVSLSLSARRAWIEMLMVLCLFPCRSVALRKESVDRNRTPHHMNTRPIPSLSARRAWIEIRFFAWITQRTLESLSARRAWIEIERPTT